MQQGVDEPPLVIDDWFTNYVYSILHIEEHDENHALVQEKFYLQGKQQ
jgi:hypothetical protein